MNQPLLVVKAKASDIRAGMAAFIYLVPELCRMTGLNTAMRCNQTLMRELAKYTRVDPKQRVEKLLMFNARLNNTKQAVTVSTPLYTNFYCKHFPIGRQLFPFF